MIQYTMRILVTAIAVLNLLAAQAANQVEYCELALSISNIANDSEVTYDAKMWWLPDGDRYIVEYTRRGDDKLHVAAYSGNLYLSYDGVSSRVYHADADSIAFRGAGAVNRSDLLYKYIPTVLRLDMDAINTASGVTVTKEGDCGAVITQSCGGEIIRKIEYRANGKGNPESYNCKNNPGEEKEQVIKAVYSYPDNYEAVEITDAYILNRYASLNTGTKKELSNLAGHRVPAITATDMHTRKTADMDFATNGACMLIFLESGQIGNREFIVQMRKNTTRKIILLYANKNVDEIADETSGLSDEGEVYIGCKRSAAKMGVSLYPTVIYVGEDGVVEKYMQE